MDAPLRCRCGYRVRPRDIVEGGSTVGKDGLGAVYLKYVCGHCERVVPVWLSLTEWDEGRILEEPETTEEEPAAEAEVEELGLITHAEVRRFSEALNGSADCILGLRTALDPRRRRGRRPDRRGDRPSAPREQ